MKFLYEFSFLLPELSEKEKKEFLENIKKKIKEIDGEIEDEFEQKQNFAYPVKKIEKGIFGFISFFADKKKIKKFEESLKYEKNLLRYLIERKKVKKVEKVEKKVEKPKKVKLEKLEEKLEEIVGKKKEKK